MIILKVNMVKNYKCRLVKFNTIIIAVLYRQLRWKAICSSRFSKMWWSSVICARCRFLSLSVYRENWNKRWFKSNAACKYKEQKITFTFTLHFFYNWLKNTTIHKKCYFYCQMVNCTLGFLDLFKFALCTDTMVW